MHSLPPYLGYPAPIAGGTPPQQATDILVIPSLGAMLVQREHEGSSAYFYPRFFQVPTQDWQLILGKWSKPPIFGAS